MLGGAIWHEKPILSACLGETPATYSQSLTGWFDTVSDAFAFFYTIYANTKWPEGWPIDQPNSKIEDFEGEGFYFGRETKPESSHCCAFDIIFLQNPWTELLYDHVSS